MYFPGSRPRTRAADVLLPSRPRRQLGGCGQVDRWTGGQVYGVCLKNRGFTWFTIKIYANHVFSFGLQPQVQLSWLAASKLVSNSRPESGQRWFNDPRHEVSMHGGREAAVASRILARPDAINHPVLAHHFQLRCRWKWSEQSMALQDLFASEEHVDEAGHWGAWRGLITADLHWKGGASKAMPIYHPYFDGVYTSHFW